MKFLLVLLLILLNGCYVNANITQQAVSACIAKGGVPIVDKWSGNVAACVFPK